MLNRCTTSILVIAFIASFSTLQADEIKKQLFSVSPGSNYSQVKSELTKSGVAQLSDAKQNSLIDSRPKQNVSRGSAMLRSLILPGWGESYLGYSRTARFFFWTDMTIWAGLIGFETYSRWKEDQFIAYASNHAGAQMQGKSDEFYADIGNYDNIDAYNEAKLRERNYEALYTSSSYYWAWDSKTNRLTYDDIRIASRSAHNKVYFFLGAAALNRLISFVDTGKKARDIMKQNSKPQVGFHFQPQYEDGASNISLVLSAEF